MRTGFPAFLTTLKVVLPRTRLPYPVQAKGTHRNQGYTFLFGNSRYHLGWIARTDMIRYPDSDIDKFLFYFLKPDLCRLDMTLDILW